MNLGVITLIALALAVTLSITTSLNVGVLAIGLAWVIGVYLGGFSVTEIMGGFPVNLFLTLAGVTLLFSQAQANGTLEKVAHQAVRLCRGRVGMVPVLYFFLGGVLASMGPGNIATAGLLAPMAMATAARMNIPLFLMAIMVGNGANAGSLSPIAPTGIIVSGVMDRIGLNGLEVETWLYNFLAHAIVAFSGFMLFGGWKLLARADRVEEPAGGRPEPLNGSQIVTLGMIGALILGVVLVGMNIGMAAFAAAVVIGLVRAANTDDAIKAMPWGTILLVCGVTVLISLLERTSGMDIVVDMLTGITSRTTIIPFLAATVGLISAYSSTSGVVLPAFLPIVPGLDASLGGGMATALAMTMNVGGHLVDVSPLSTIGALCVAGVATGPASRRLFNQMLAWGLSMTVAGAVICFVLFG
jgi:Na+/H+ antiporter NhaD/arsenite permease-like protein